MSKWIPQNPRKMWGNKKSAWAVFTENGHTVDWEVTGRPGFGTYTGRIRVDNVVHPKTAATQNILKPFLESRGLLATYSFLFR